MHEVMFNAPHPGGTSVPDGTCVPDGTSVSVYAPALSMILIRAFMFLGNDDGPDKGLNGLSFTF